ncbi:unnamed protein product [Vicia faba]|uniref:NADP-dependent oxidoreductase domain-containing protein n=1 Tax=Vicia faba TaxID=3906 RepID=A0AAV1AE11_VICFA|nr:unnamed protein product [Vicia faba]
MQGQGIKDLIINSIKIGYRHFDCTADYKNKNEVGEAFKEAFDTGFQISINFTALLQTKRNNISGSSLKLNIQSAINGSSNKLIIFTSIFVKRENLFITTKLWNSNHGHVVEACKDSIKKLQLDYLDLYLVHFPVATRHTGVGTTDSALGEDGVLDIDTTISLETTWHAMEGLVSSGLVRSIGINNYDVFLNRDCLAYSKIKLAVNQIETHSTAKQKSITVNS